jgi:hypothetical protein
LTSVKFYYIMNEPAKNSDLLQIRPKNKSDK